MAEELLKTTGIASAITEARATMAGTSFINSISFALEAKHMETAGGMTSAMSEELMKTTRMFSLSEISIEYRKVSHVIASVGGLAAMGIKDVVSKAFFSQVETSHIISLGDTIQGLSKSLDAYIFSSSLSSLSESFKKIVEPINAYQLTAEMNPLGEKLKEIGAELKINSFATAAIDSLSKIQKQIDSKTISFIEARKKILTEFKTISIALDPGTALNKKNKKETERLKKDYFCELETEIEKLKIENEEMKESYELIIHEERQIRSILLEQIIVLKEENKNLKKGAPPTNGSSTKAPDKPENEIEKIPWNGLKSQLKRLFKALKKERLLRSDMEYSEFEIHFNIKGIQLPYQETETDKIRWMGTIRQLVYLNKLLIDEELFFEEKKYKLLADNFKDKNGNDLHPTQLCNSYKEFGTNPIGRRFDQIREIVEKI
jgi:hypothetical protein